MNGYEELANAIILQAVSDYRTAKRKLKKHPDNKKAKFRLKDCERFFQSKWFEVLTPIDGQMLLKKLKEE